MGEIERMLNTKTVVNKTVQKGGALLIPSSAVGRAQTLQHMLVTLMKEGAIPTLPIYLDSPMATSFNISEAAASQAWRPAGYNISSIG